MADVYGREWSREMGHNQAVLSEPDEGWVLDLNDRAQVMAVLRHASEELTRADAEIAATEARARSAEEKLAEGSRQSELALREAGRKLAEVEASCEELEQRALKAELERGLYIDEVTRLSEQVRASDERAERNQARAQALEQRLGWVREALNRSEQAIGASGQVEIGLQFPRDKRSFRALLRARASSTKARLRGALVFEALGQVPANARRATGLACVALLGVAGAGAVQFFSVAAPAEVSPPQIEPASAVETLPGFASIPVEDGPKHARVEAPPPAGEPANISGSTPENGGVRVVSSGLGNDELQQELDKGTSAKLDRMLGDVSISTAPSSSRQARRKEDRRGLSVPTSMRLPQPVD